MSQESDTVLMKKELLEIWSKVLTISFFLNKSEFSNAMQCLRKIKTKQVRLMIEVFQPISFSSMEKKMKKSYWREKQNRDLISHLEWEYKYIFLWEKKKSTFFFFHAFPSLVLLYSSLWNIAD